MAQYPADLSYETRFDYDVRTDSNPVYIGQAPTGAATSAPAWNIQKFTYDASSRPTRVEILYNQVWDNRASLAWP